MKQFFTLLVFTTFVVGGNSQITTAVSPEGNYSYKNYFEDAYSQHPGLPEGILEAIAWSYTRVNHITDAEPESCSGLPHVYGVMGLTADGKNYFRNNLRLVSEISGVPQKILRENPRQNILGYAEAFSYYYNEHLDNYSGKFAKDPTLKKFLAARDAFFSLCEIPDSGMVNDYARQSQAYVIFNFLNSQEHALKYNFPVYHIDLKKIFGEENYKILSAPKVIFTENEIKNENGDQFSFVSVRSSDYGPAIWNAAPSCNYSSRNGTPVSAITVHTVQGSYAGAISWAQNCSSSVSYHYVIRSSDGQITQMVLEANKAWHVGSENPYTIGYEHEGYVSQQGWYTTAMYTASAALSRDVCNSGYGISPLRTYYGASSTGINVLGSCTKIKGHQHYPNQTHTDPGIYWDWEYYYQLINNNPSQTTITSTTGNFYDSGGPGANYTDDERYLTLIQPAGANSITLTFSSFNIEANWDYMYIYDGATINDPVIGVYTGTSSPGTVTSTGGALLIEFRSDCNTTASGWAAAWTSNVTIPPVTDNVAPVTAVSVPSSWVTSNFTATFSDADNTGGSGIEKAFYQVIDYNGIEWRANAARGFFSDNFDGATVHTDWTNATGAWNITNGELVQSDEANGNSNLYAYVNHSLSNRYLYHWAGKMEGTGTNRRAGLHYFCDQPTLTNRGNSYFVWFRLDNDKVQLYKVVNDVFTLEDEVVFDFNAAQWYDFKVTYDRITGKHQVYIDNVLVQTWTDPSPYSSGDYISWRSGNCVYSVNNLKVYRSRNTTASVTVGPTGDLRYENTSPVSAAGRVKSIVTDSAGNISSIASQDVNVDWTVPSNILLVEDGPGADIDITYTATELQANWSVSSDLNSDVARYWYAIGTSAGATDVLNWTDNFWYDTVRVTGLNLNYGTTYYFTVKAENGAGLISAVTNSDGQLLATPTQSPVAGFNSGNTFVCQNDSISFSNNSTNAVSYSWSFPGGNPATSTLPNPNVLYTATGTYTITLIATGPGGSDTLQQTINIDVSLPVTAAFTVSDTLVYLPSAFVGFTDASQNANGWSWDFGDGTQATGQSPWHQYLSAGTYNVVLIAVNNACTADTSYITIYVQASNGTEELNNIPGAITISPNPAEDFITIESPAALAGTSCEVRDISGKLVFVFTLTGQKQVLNLETLSSGGYFLVNRNDKSIPENKLFFIKSGK
ncbi:MAG: N-acetylmuramoyl-L-alanine amidase [Bacteroidota bacterium]